MTEVQNDTQAVDVLTDLTMCRDEMARVVGARKADAALSAVAELIEADREYDAAREANRSAHQRGQQHLLAESMRRFDAAAARRAAALARLGGAA